MFRRKNRKLPRWRKILVPELTNGQMARPGSPLRRRAAATIKIGVLALVVYGFATGQEGTVRLVKLYRERQQLQDEERRITAEIVQLDNVCRYLETDTAYIEQIAREDYGLSRPNEIIYLDAQAQPSR